MTTRIIVGIVALGCGPICAMAASFANLEMIDKVNEKLPNGEQFAKLWWYLSKYQRLRREYERLYPKGRLLLKVRVLTVVVFACGLICVWGFGLFAK
jgi:hypothetical protein